MNKIELKQVKENSEEFWSVKAPGGRWKILKSSPALISSKNAKSTIFLEIFDYTLSTDSHSAIDYIKKASCKHEN